MALSLSSERSPAVATFANPFAAFVRWIAKVQTARTRRKALLALLDLDHDHLMDLGISRDDVVTALSSNCAGLVLTEARSRNSRV